MILTIKLFFQTHTLLGAILSASTRQSQGSSGSADRFPVLLTHETIRRDTLEAQGKGLNVLLTLVEGTGRPLDENICPVYIAAVVC